jgi:hypothetical protein
MTPRAAQWLAWWLFAVYAAATAATLGLVTWGAGTPDDANVVWIVGFAVVGVLVARREPDNSVGWLLLSTAAFYGLSGLAYSYARVPDRPGVAMVAWFASWSWVPWIYLTMILLPLVFPTGRPLSPRWRPALALVGVATVLTVLGTAFLPGHLDVESPTPIPNPLGASGVLATVFSAAALAGGVLGAAGLVLAAFSLVQRLRSSRGRERQQLKVFVFVVVAFLVDAAIFVTGLVFSSPSAPGWVRGLNDVAWLPGVLLLTVGLPLAIGIAMLRHHLYGIDVVINRTLVYGVLTVTLGAAYLGLVLVLRLVLSPLTGESDLAVAGSTLAVAALFRPARARVQALVDSRFYRARYDAARTLETFSGRLREQIDLDALGADLRDVVRVTVHPAHVSLWLRDAP